MNPVKRTELPRTAPDPITLEDQIRLRAYELYEARGREDGRDCDDWFQAEAEIRGRRREATAA